MAADLQLDGVEFDVRLSSDGIPVVIHDDDLRRVAGHPARVGQNTAAQLAEFDLGNGQGVPSLQDVLSKLNGRIRVMLELKGSEISLIDPVVSLCADTPDLYFLSFDASLLAAAGKRMPHVPLVLNLESSPGAMDWDTFSVLSCPLDQWAPDQIQRARAEGKQAWAFSLQQNESWNHAISLGLDAVFADDPQAVQAHFVDSSGG